MGKLIRSKMLEIGTFLPETIERFDVKEDPALYAKLLSEKLDEEVQEFRTAGIENNAIINEAADVLEVMAAVIMELYQYTRDEAINLIIYTTENKTLHRGDFSQGIIYSPEREPNA